MQQADGNGLAGLEQQSYHLSILPRDPIVFWLTIAYF